jgi:hypothetical protein
MTNSNEHAPIKKNSAVHPHRRLPFFSILLLILLSAAMLWAALARDIQAASPISLPVEFYGEYSRNQTDWQPLSKDADLNALNGDLYLRGHFSDDLSGIVVSCHLDHIYYSIAVNGENAAGYIPKRAFAEPVVCGSDWSSWKIDSLSANDTVEIHLSNPPQSRESSCLCRIFRQSLPRELFVFQQIYAAQQPQYRCGSTLWHRQ